MEDRVSLFDRAFGLVIGFLLPGLLPLAALALADGRVAAWFTGAQNGPTLAGLVLILLAALAIGLVLTAVRFCLFELTGFVPAPPALDEAKRAAHQSTYVRLQVDHYFHYLAYANLAVAMPLAAITYYVFSAAGPSGAQAFVALVVLIGLTVAAAVAARDALRRYNRKREQLFARAA